MRNKARLFKILSEVTRLNMLALLFHHTELTGGDFEQILGISQSKASRHLQHLLNAGLVVPRRESIFVFYRLARNLSPEKRIVISSARRVLVGRDVDLLCKRMKRVVSR